MNLSINFLICLKNAYTAGKKKIVAPSSTFVESIAKLIKKNNFIEDYSVKKLENGSQQISVDLKYINKTPAINHLKLYSKPGRRLYCDSVTIPWGVEPNALIIISTSKGLLNQKQAQKGKVGGELIAQIW